MSIVFEYLVAVNMILTLMLFPVIIIMLIEYRSFNKSTHRIEYVQPPLSPILDDAIDDGMSEKEFNKIMDPDDDFLE